MYDSQVADAVQVIAALAKAGIKIKTLDEATRLAATDPIPETLRGFSVDEETARLAEVIDDPERLAAVAAEHTLRRSSGYEQARRLRFVDRDLRVLRLFADAAQDLDKALVKALQPARDAVVAAEKALAALSMSRPRLMLHDQDGKPIKAAQNTAKGQLRHEAVERRDGGEALKAVQAHEDAMSRYSALHGVVNRLALLKALPSPAACLKLTEPIECPPERSETQRRADLAEREAKRGQQAFSTTPDERSVWTGSKRPERLPV